MNCIYVSLLSLLLSMLSGCEPPASSPTQQGDHVVKVKGLPESKEIGTAPVKITVDADEQLKARLEALLNADQKDSTIRLNIHGLDTRKQRVSLSIYVNTSDDEPTPGASSPHYLGSITNFGEGKQGPNTLDIVPVLKKLAEKKLWKPGDPLTFRLSTIPMSGKVVVENPILVSKLELELPEKK